MSTKSIFDTEPTQWGLRGDPNLWAALGEIFKDHTFDMPPMDFESELDNQFNTFLEEKGRPQSDRVVWVPSFPQYGMSGGAVSLEWWNEKGLPLLKERYRREYEKTKAL